MGKGTASVNTHVRIRCGSLSITTPVPLQALVYWVRVQANKFEVRSALHGQVSLAAAHHICVFHE